LNLFLFGHSKNNDFCKTHFKIGEKGTGEGEGYWVGWEVEGKVKGWVEEGENCFI